ncbi:MAG: gamma-glutamyl-gamma-aminobutyrate hydrolase family protein [Nitrospirota bacterium]
MHVLIVKNITTEGPGTIEDFLKEKGMDYSVVDFSGCDSSEADVPDVRKFTHLVIMGGPMAVYESAGAPFLHFEVAMIRAFILSKKPVLGICLGAQMIAYALKADVYAGDTQEIGWDKVDITSEGMNDPAFASLSVNSEPIAEVFQWHGDTFDLPKKAVCMASSAAYQNQAFKYGSNVYGLQFHIEVTPDMIREWFEKEKGVDADKMVEHSQKIFTDYRKRAMNFYESFFDSGK